MRPPTRAMRTASGAVRNRPWKAARSAAPGDRCALVRIGEHRVDHRRMSGGQHLRAPWRRASHRLSPSPRAYRPLRQPLGLGHAGARFALDVAAQPDRARLGQNLGAQRRAPAAICRCPTVHRWRPAWAAAATAVVRRARNSRARFARCRSSRVLRSAATLARIAARSDRNSGSAASASRSLARRVSPR